MNGCRYCTGSLSALHHGGQTAYVHLWCTACGAHAYGAPDAPRWRTRREWSAWVEDGHRNDRLDTAEAA